MNIDHILSSLMTIINEMSPYILLGFFIAGLLHVFVSPQSMSRHLSGNSAGSVIKAALLGIPLPLCSCGVLPTAISLRRNGASRGATTSFLIATPQTGVDSITATYSLLGLPFAVLRPIAALVGAALGGLAVNRLAKEEKEEVLSGQACCAASDDIPQGFWPRMIEALRYGFVDMVQSVGKWLVIGLVVAALITVFVPDTLFTGLSRYPLLAMIAVVIVAIPMYICATGSIPIALSLMMKGLSPGIAFVMLMAGPAANFASILLLSRTQGKRATAVYIGSVVVTAIGFGLMIDLLLPASWFTPSMACDNGGCAAHGAHSGWFDYLCSAVLLVLLCIGAVKSRLDNRNKLKSNDMTQIFNVKGMSCNHCKASVEKAIKGVEGVSDVHVDLSAGTATVEGEFDAENVRKAILSAGFEL